MLADFLLPFGRLSGRSIPPGSGRSARGAELDHTVGIGAARLMIGLAAAVMTRVIALHTPLAALGSCISALPARAFGHAAARTTMSSTSQAVAMSFAFPWPDISARGLMELATGKLQ